MDQGQQAPQAQQAAAAAPPAQPPPPPAPLAPPAPPAFALGPGRSHAVLDYDDPNTVIQFPPEMVENWWRYGGELVTK